MRATSLFKSLALFMFMVSGNAFGISDFSLPWYNHGDNNPATFNSKDYKDTTFVIEVYQLRCPPCNTNAKNVSDLADAYKNNPKVKVLSIGIDQDQASYRQWVLRHNPNHPVLIDTGRQVSQQLGVSSTPSTYVLDCNLDVKWNHTGVWTSANADEIKDKISVLSTQSCR